MSTRPNKFKTSLVWLRRDLRIHDHAALSAALHSSDQVYVAFVFDRTILDELPSKTDRRVEFIWHAVNEIDQRLKRHNSRLVVRYGESTDVIPSLVQLLNAQAVFANHDYEPQAMARDERVKAQLLAQGCAMFTYKDQVIFERHEILTQTATPYSVFTPYKNTWLKRLSQAEMGEHEVQSRLHQLAPMPDGFPGGVPPLEQIGFKPTNLEALKLPLGTSGGTRLLIEFKERVGQYHQTRDYPAVRGPSYLSVHLRFGTVSIRELLRMVWPLVDPKQTNPPNEGAQTWLNELIWRDFYFQILFHHPHVAKRSFKSEYDRIVWDKNPKLYKAWCQGKTGYPLVDAAMVQLNTSGYMHNRLRMVTASFFTKDLGLDWRQGEAYFAMHLNDFDLSANNGGWQWASSSGCDAQPYFRIFNPVTQSEKFDPEGKFIKRYLPVLAKVPIEYIHAPWKMPPLVQKQAGIEIGEDYPLPVVDHDVARQKTLERYSVVKGS